MKKKIIALFALALANSLYASWPMESVDRYNIVLVHGAADRWQGLDCVNGEGGESYAEAYSNKQGVVTDPSTCHRDSVEVPVPNAINPDSTRDSVFTECDTAYYNPKRIGGIIHGADTGSSATGMVKELFPFLNEELLESPYAAYLQRPFVHPAGSPADNADEIGKSNWMGSGMCSARRSLIEEAKEFKAHGQDTLRMYRESANDRYRKIASRNILVGHSMGGVAIREYVQGPNYNRDVDKFVTLDSPHEGTGALNALLDLDDWRHQLGDAVSSSIYATMTATGIALLVVGRTHGIIYPALISLGAGFVGDALQQLIKEVAWYRGFKDKGFDYRYGDGLVSYINPEEENSGINNLKNRDIDCTFPMARLLGAENSMTFTDPNSSFREYFNLFYPEFSSVPLMNAGYHFFGGDGSATIRVVNAETGYLLGLAGISVQESGSALIPTSSGLAKNTSALESGKVDIVRRTYNAAVHAETGDQNVFSDVFTTVGVSLLTVDYALNAWCSACAAAAKTAIGVAGSLYLAGGITASMYLGVKDLNESHDIPKNLDFHRSHFGEVNNYSKIQGEPQRVTPYLMEDFLYERPFVNLALSLSDSALRSVDPGCYYEADDANKQQLCEVGLYGSRDSIVVNTHVIGDSTGAGKDSVWYDTTHFHNAVAERLDSIGNVVRDSSGKVVYDSVYYGTFEQRNYSDFRSSPLKFKSESDWYKVGVKVDRWERVDGLKPNGDLAPKGVPIRHVERYSVPDIVATGFIEKYSFVVDDLMPHRMRQIKMTFNSNEEVAWECNIKAAEDDPHACAVYKRLLGNSWGSPDTTIGDKGYVPHPIKKNGRFDFEARKYFGNLANIQKA